MTQVLDASPSVAAGLLQLARLKSGLSQRQLAEKAGVPTTMISAYERDLRQPTLPTLLRLLNAAGLDLRMQLVALDDHDLVLERSDANRSLEEKNRLDLQLARWRDAEPA
jgi:transcriptional regulator with XRE-family HTH domain